MKMISLSGLMVLTVSWLQLTLYKIYHFYEGATLFNDSVAIRCIQAEMSNKLAQSVRTYTEYFAEYCFLICSLLNTHKTAMQSPQCRHGQVRALPHSMNRRRRAAAPPPLPELARQMQFVTLFYEMALANMNV